MITGKDLIAESAVDNGKCELVPCLVPRLYLAVLSDRSEYECAQVKPGNEATCS